MNTEQIVDYVMETPTNTNKAVLRGMLDEATNNSPKITAIPVYNIRLYGSASQIRDYGFSFTDNKTLKDIIGDKQIIGCTVEPDGDRDSNSIPEIYTLFGLWTSIRRQDGQGYDTYDLMTHQNDDFIRNNATGIHFHYYSPKDLSKQGSGTLVTIYLLCI